jgi:hypothetical protein
MPTFFQTVNELVVPTASSWQTIDLSSYFASGETPAGVLVMVTNKGDAQYTAGIRAGGSTSANGWPMRNYQRMYYWSAISTDKKIQLYSTNLTNLDFHLLGWLSTAEAYFPVERYQTVVASDTGSTYVDIDPSSIVQPGDTPAGYFVHVQNATSGGLYEMVGVRPNGSTDTFLQRLQLGAAQTFAVSTNDGLFEVRFADTGLGGAGDLTVRVTGYLKSTARVKKVINAQTIQNITEGAGWASVANDKTLDGVRVEDILCQLGVLAASGSEPSTFTAALAGSSTDTPLSWQYRPYIHGGLFSAARGFAHWPLLRSRVADKAQTVRVDSPEFTSAQLTYCALYAYLGFRPRSSAGPLVMGGLF